MPMNHIRNPYESPRESQAEAVGMRRFQGVDLLRELRGFLMDFVGRVRHVASLERGSAEVYPSAP